MSTIYDITHKRGDTFKGREFQLTTYELYPTLLSLPATGVTGVIYKAEDTGLFYKWVTTVYVVTTDKVYVDLTGASILCQLKTVKNINSPVAATYSMSDLSGITVTNAAIGKFRIDAQIIDIPAKAYFYDIQVTSAGGIIETYVEGIWTILGDVSTYV